MFATAQIVKGSHSLVKMQKVATSRHLGHGISAVKDIRGSQGIYVMNDLDYGCRIVVQTGRSPTGSV